MLGFVFILDKMMISLLFQREVADNEEENLEELAEQAELDEQQAVNQLEFEFFGEETMKELNLEARKS